MSEKKSLHGCLMSKNSINSTCQTEPSGNALHGLVEGNVASSDGLHVNTSASRVMHAPGRTTTTTATETIPLLHPTVTTGTATTTVKSYTPSFQSPRASYSSVGSTTASESHQVPKRMRTNIGSVGSLVRMYSSQTCALTDDEDDDVRAHYAATHMPASSTSLGCFKITHHNALPRGRRLMDRDEVFHQSMGVWNIQRIGVCDCVCDCDCDCMCHR